MHVFGNPGVHGVLLCIWFPLTPTVLTLDLVERRRAAAVVIDHKSGSIFCENYVVGPLADG